MEEGKNNNQREDYYHKYHSSNIFNTDITSKMNVNIPKITPKPTEREYTKKFEPNYKNSSAYETYIRNFYEIDDKEIKQLYEERKKKKELENKKIKSRNEQLNRNYSATARYYTEFFGEKYNKEKEIKKRKINRTNSFYEISSFQFPKDTKNKLNYSTTRDYSSQKKFESNLSNIFFQTPKTYKYKKPLNLQKENNLLTENSEKYLKASRNRQKAILPYKFDWTKTNTEIACKTHIENCKNLQDKQIYNSRPKEFIKEIYDNTKTPFKEKRENYNKILPDKDHYKFEVIGNKDIFLKLDPISIKRMFLKEGIHIYNFDNNVTHNDISTNGKFTFHLRKDQNDETFKKKFDNISKEINSYGVKLKEVKINHNLFKKIRKGTPGKELLNRKKK